MSYAIDTQTRLINTPETWTLIASLDQSESYEVDFIEIYKHEGKYILATASGCSCWERDDWDFTEYPSLAALALALRTTDQPRWNASTKAAEALIAAATVHAAWANIGPNSRITVH